MPQTDTLHIREACVYLTPIAPSSPHKPARQAKDEALAAALLQAGQNPSLLQRTPEGKPFLLDAQPPFISISHSATLLALAIGNKPIGIDIEVLSPRTTKVIPRILSSKEKNAILGTSFAPSVETATAIWTAKEAVFKLFSPQLEVITQVEIATLSPTLATTSEPYAAHVDFLPYRNHLIALATSC